MNTIKSLFKAGVLGCIVAAFSACNGQKGYVINGQVEGLDDGTVVTLVPMSHDNDSAIAEATVEGGKFQLVGMADEPICAQVRVKDNWGGPYVMLENVEMNLQGKIADVREVPAGKLYDWEATVTGSPLTDKLATFDARHDSLDILYKEYQEKFAEVYQKMRSLKGAELAAFQQTDECKAAVDAEKNFFDTVESTIMGMVNDNKDSFWGPLLLTKYMNYLGKEQADYYNGLPEDVTLYTRVFNELATRGINLDMISIVSENGTAAITFSVVSGDMENLRHFWASWCGPCRRELPNVKKAYAEFNDKGFEVVSISIDQKEEDWRKALKEEQLQWPNFRDNAVADQFKVKAVPTVYLCDANGNIVAANEECRGEALAAKLKELLK